ncbi:MAG: hypothetical protein AAGC55_05610, partial [Myxococcota bacterium]
AELEAKNTELKTAAAEREKAQRASECDELVAGLVEGGHIAAGGSAETLIRTCYADGNYDYAKKLADSYREESDDGDSAAGEKKAPTARPELEKRQTPASATLGANGAAAGPAVPAVPDFAAAFGRLPETVREFAGHWANNPRRYFQLNPVRAEAVGLDLSQPDDE